MRRKQGEPGQKFWTEDVAARCHGTAVVLTGWVVSERATRQRYTDTYVKGEDGGWVVAASHLSSQPSK